MDGEVGLSPERRAVPATDRALVARTWPDVSGMDKQQACRALGIDWYRVDSAIPQPWLDAIAAWLSTGGERYPRPDEQRERYMDAYDMVRCGTVWSYEEPHRWGKPVALTAEVAAAIAAYEARSR